jgi:hypothetical protein
MRLNRRPVVLSLSLAIVSVESASQELRAVTLDRETKQPVVDVRVSLLSRRRAELDTARTGPDGSFALRAKEPGKYFLQIRRTGYLAEETDAIFLAEGETRFDTLYIAPAKGMRTVESIVDRELFRLFGVTASSLSDRALILPDEVEAVRRSSRYASDVVMQKGPSYVRVNGAGTGRVCYEIQGGGCAAVYLNGQPIPSSTDIPASDLEAVAILRQMDVQVTSSRSYNGVVMLFTRSMLRT